MGINEKIKYNGVPLTEKQYSIVMFMHQYLQEQDNMPTRKKITEFLGISGVFSAQRHVVVSCLIVPGDKNIYSVCLSTSN